MINTEIFYYICQEHEKIKKMHLSPGTMDVDGNHITLYKKSRVAGATAGVLLGAAGALSQGSLSGKGKMQMTIPKDMVRSQEPIYNKGSLLCNTLHLKDGRKVYIQGGWKAKGEGYQEQMAFLDGLPTEGQPSGGGYASRNEAYSEPPRNDYNAGYNNQSSQQNYNAGYNNQSRQQSYNAGYNDQGRQQRYNAGFNNQNSQQNQGGSVKRFCPFCGMRLNGTPAFCGGCGNPLDILNGSAGQSQNRTEPRKKSREEILREYNEQCNYYYQNQDYESELRVLKEAETIFPDEPDIQVRMGRAYRMLGDYDKALVIYNYAISMNRNDPSIYHGIGCVYVSKEMYEIAKIFEERAVRMIEDRRSLAEQSVRAKIFAGYAMCCAKTNDKVNAQQYIVIAENEGYDPENAIKIRNMI